MLKHRHRPVNWTGQHLYLAWIYCGDINECRQRPWPDGETTISVFSDCFSLQSKLLDSVILIRNMKICDYQEFPLLSKQICLLSPLLGYTTPKCIPELLPSFYVKRFSSRNDHITDYINDHLMNWKETRTQVYIKNHFHYKTAHPHHIHNFHPKTYRHECTWCHIVDQY